MNTGGTLQIKSISSEATESIARAIGRNLHGGETIELISDVGGGKTTFTRGLVSGAGSNDTVGSPTFTISREYRAPHFTIRHFDFYRLSEPGIVAHELAEFLDDKTAVTVIEWGDIVQDVLPPERISMHILQTGEAERIFDIAYTHDLAYVFEGVHA